MRLYSRTDTAAVEHDGVHYEPENDGGFEFPEDVGEHLHGFHTGGKPQWETQIERQHRLMGEEAERRKDPATLLSAVEQLVKAAQATQTSEPEDAKAAPAKRTSKRATASKPPAE